jgi:hypothetical protein
VGLADHKRCDILPHSFLDSSDFCIHSLTSFECKHLKNLSTLYTIKMAFIVSRYVF